MYMLILQKLIPQKKAFRAIPLVVATMLYTTPALCLESTRKPPIPLESILNQVRKQHGNVVIYNARLIQEDHRTVRLIDFNNNWKKPRDGMQRLIIDAYTGKEIELASMKYPMSLEKTLNNLRKKHQIASITKTWMDNKDGHEIRVIEFIDHKKKRWHANLDAYTGLVFDEHIFELKPSGKQIPLSDIINNARQTNKNMVILRTAAKHQKNIPVREIVYLDENNLRKRLIVNAITGDVISDQINTNILQ